MDYKEYSRLRSIARKRIERASKAGRGEYVFLPTVKQVRASGNPEAYLQSVKTFLTGPTYREAQKDNTPFKKIELPKEPLPIPPKQTSEAKQARRREQNRRSKAKRAVERAAGSEAEARKKVGYLKALETVSKQWREAGVDIGNWLGVLSPAKAKAFTNYMEYRFSQGDYSNKYSIDTFIRDFGELVKKNYDFKDIEKDFGSFLEKQKQLKKNKRNTNKYGISEDEINSAWRRFVKGSTDAN